MQLRRYLLGELEGEALDWVELALLEDPATVEGLTGAQDELIEDYLTGVLSASERGRFEAHFLASAEHRRAFEGARLLRNIVPAREPARHSPAATGARWGLAVAAAIVLVALAAGLLWRGGPSRESPPATAASLAPAPPVSPEAPATTDPSEPAAARPQIASLTLAPGRQMAGAPTAQVRLMPETGVLRVSLIVEDPALRLCSVSLSSPERGELWRATALRPSRTAAGTTLLVDVPAEGLQAGSEYRIALLAEPSGNRSGSYYFQVVRR